MRLLAAAIAAVSFHIHPVAPGWAISVDNRGDVLGGSFVIRDGKRRALNGTAVAMNDRGDVVGFVGQSTILWRADGTRTSLGLGLPAAINDNGWVVGDGFIWHDGSRISIDGQARAVNDRNQVVGVRGTHAFLWQDGVQTDLPSFHGELTEAVKINDSGLIVGDARPSDPADPDHAIYWRNGVVRSLGTFGHARSLTPVDVNDRGEVLVDTEFPDHHAWIWRSGKLRDLGTLGHPWWNVAADINDNGVVVGNVQRAPHGPNVPYIWRNGTYTVLPALDGYGPPTSSTAHVNDRGVVVGASYGRRGSVAVVWR